MKIKELMCCCLFFTANRLSRIMTKIAEDKFSRIGLTSTEALALMILNELKKCSSSNLGNFLHLKPSTVTRFIDKLILKKYCEREHVGKMSIISLSQQGIDIQKDIEKCWESIYHEYSQKIGYEEGKELSTLLYSIADKLEN